jgi:hypothetical protein
MNGRRLRQSIQAQGSRKNDTIASIGKLTGSLATKALTASLGGIHALSRSIISISTSTRSRAQFTKIALYGIVAFAGIGIITIV